MVAAVLDFALFDMAGKPRVNVNPTPAEQSGAWNMQARRHGEVVPQHVFLDGFRAAAEEAGQVVQVEYFGCHDFSFVELVDVVHVTSTSPGMSQFVPVSATR